MAEKIITEKTFLVTRILVGAAAVVAAATGGCLEGGWSWVDGHRRQVARMEECQ